MKHKFVLILLLMFLSITFSQNRIQVSHDSLESKNFKELKTIFYNNFDNKKVAESIALFTLKKAKAENYQNGIINSYMRLNRVTRDDELKSLKYIDSCISTSKQYENKELLAEGYFYKARLLYLMKDYEESLSFYLKSREYYKNYHDKYMYFLINHNIGFIKLRIRANEDALEIFKECFEYEKRINSDTLSMSYLSTLHALSIAYAANKKFDSVSFLNKKGYLLAEKSDEFNQLKFTHIEGGNQFLKGNLKASKDSLIKTIEYLKMTEDVANLSIAYYYLGRIFEEYNRPIEFISYYKKVDSIFNEEKYIIQTPREAYIGLINYYKQKKDFKNQLYYIERLLVVDSTLNKEYKNISNTFFKEYDTPKLLEEQKKINLILDTEKGNYKKTTILLFIIAIFLLLILFYFSLKKKKDEQKFNLIINNLKKKEAEKVSIEKKKNNTSKLDISEEAITSILENLNTFEKNKGFLTPKITLHSFAKEINTNRKYLSKVVNEYKLKSFNNYINDLRIQHTITRLEKDPIFKKYTIKAIAKDVGFSTTEAFTLAFKKNTGLAASFFIRKLRS